MCVLSQKSFILEIGSVISFNTCVPYEKHCDAMSSQKNLQLVMVVRTILDIARYWSLFINLWIAATVILGLSQTLFLQNWRLFFFLIQFVSRRKCKSFLLRLYLLWMLHWLRDNFKYKQLQMCLEFRQAYNSCSWILRTDKMSWDSGI